MGMNTSDVISLFILSPDSGPVRVSRDVLRELLLNHPKIATKGFMREWEFEHVGVGVYDVQLEPLERWQEGEGK